MKVVLERDVPKLGRAGQVLEAADAYVRNFLLPKGFVRIATPDQIAQLAAQAKRQRDVKTQRQADWKSAQAALLNQTIEVTAQANPQGKLFASLKAAAVAEQIKTKLHLDISDVQLTPDHWKTTGAHVVTLRWPDGTQQQLNLMITNG